MCKKKNSVANLQWLKVVQKYHLLSGKDRQVAAGGGGVLVLVGDARGRRLERL